MSSGVCPMVTIVGERKKTPLSLSLPLDLYLYLSLLFGRHFLSVNFLEDLAFSLYVDVIWEVGDDGHGKKTKNQTTNFSNFHQEQEAQINLNMMVDVEEIIS